MLAPVTGVAAQLVPLSAVAVAGAAALTVASVALSSQPAHASVSGETALILSTSVNGGMSSLEAQQLAALQMSVTVATPATWDAMTTAQFKAYNLIVIGDPSTTSCATTVPADALSTAGAWGAAVNGSVSVLGTAPALAGATTLVRDALNHAASGGSAQTGLYVSLNCEYAAASAATPVPLLASVEGGGFTVTGQGSGCPSDAGTVNTWQALALASFNGLTSANLGPWAAPACSVEETFNAWPAGLAGLGYYAGVLPGTATFTASDGATGQAYILAGGEVSTATAQLSPSTGGQVPAGSADGGSNPAAPGVNQPTAGGANTMTGDFTQSATDFSIPTFGPSLAFTRSYDTQAAQQQVLTGTQGSMGYGWSSNWSSSLLAARPLPGDIYTVDGLRTDNGNGGSPLLAPLSSPGQVLRVGSDVYIADTSENRIQEIPGTTKTQWGIAMTAGDVYTVAGSPTGVFGASGNGTPAAQTVLANPSGIAVDSQGNLYIADTGGSRVLEIPVSSGTQRGQSMTANYSYVIAGFTGVAGLGGDNKPATSSHLSSPTELAVGPGSSQDLYIADTGNNRIQEIAATTKTQWGQSMTANYVYTVAGSSAGTGGLAGNNGPATSALLSFPEGVALSAAGNMYIGDTSNCRVMEVPPKSGTQWGQSMTANDIYLVAGRGGSTNCTIGNDNKIATQSNLNNPSQVFVGPGTSEDLYIADSSNNRIQEVASKGETEWNQVMTATYVYTVAGRPGGTGGFGGDGGPSNAALMSYPQGVAVGSALYAADSGNNRIRTVNSAGVISELAGSGGTLDQVGNGGPAITAALSTPAGEAFDAAGDVFIGDQVNNRVQEIAATSHTQFGITMIAGDVYTVAGSANGVGGYSGDGGAATSALMSYPMSIALDPSGNLYVADNGNNVIREVSAATGKISTVAGTGTVGAGGDGILATSSQLDAPSGVAVDSHGDVYVADTNNNRVQEIFASGGLSWGQAMTAGDVYTIAGSAAGTAGATGDTGPATSALLSGVSGLGFDNDGNLYVADTGNNRIQEIPASSGPQRGQVMQRYYMYTIAGNAAGGTGGYSGDKGPATGALLSSPNAIAVDPAGNVYIADTFNSLIREVAVADGTQWSQPMTANYIYTVAGIPNGLGGESGDGGPATAAQMTLPLNVSIDATGNLYITDSNDNGLREIVSSATPTIQPAPGLTSSLYPTPGSTMGTTTYVGGITVTQPDGSQVTFYSQVGGKCPSAYVPTGVYCALPQDVSASLSFNSSTNSYTFSPQPGTSYTYNAPGQLTSESDAAGNTLTVTYGIAPGTGSCPSNANTSTCQVITSASGRALTVGYNASNLITSVTDPMGRAWSYAYAGSDLTSVTDPMGHVTTYGYDTANASPLLASDMTTITRPNGQAGGPDAGARTTIAYDTAGRVTSETDPMGYATTYAWAGYNPSTGNGVITVTDPDGNKTVYYYSQGTLAAQSAWTGTTLTSEQDYVPNQAAGVASGGTQLVMASADGNGVITSTTYDTAGNLATSTAPDGITSSGGTQQLATTTAQSTALGLPSCTSGALATSTCTSSPGPSPVTPGGVITPPSSAPPQGLTWTQYDNYGNELYATTGVYEPGSNTPAYSRTTYQLFKGNSVTLGTTSITCAATPPSASLPCAKINADGVVTQLAYNAQGDLTSSATPDGNSGGELATTADGYDGDGEQTSATAPDGNLAGANAGNYTTTTAWNNDGQKTTVTQAGGTGATVTPRTTSYGYDGDGNQTTVTDARGYTTTTTFNADDQASLVTDPDGNSTLTCYDGAGNTVQTVPPAGVAASGLTAASCPAGYSTRLAADATVDTFNALGQKTQETTPAPAGQTGYETTTYAYDANGNLLTTTAPPATNGGPSQVTADTYTATGQIASETTGSGTAAAATITYCYDPAGNKTAVTYGDANTGGTAPCETAYPWVINATGYPTQAGYQTTYAYDSAGELVSTTTPATTAAPSGATTSETYDAAGNTLTRTDPNNTTTTWTYTPLNNPATVTYSGGSAHSVSYGYDANGNKISMTDADGSSSYIYDPFSELTSTTNGAGQTTGYGYNADDRTSSITYPLPADATWATTDTVNYTYDNADLLIKMTDFTGISSSVGYSADSLPTSIALGSTGDIITTSYSPTDMPSLITLNNSVGALQSFAYSDSPADIILTETDTPASSLSPVNYSYDAVHRVTSMTPGIGSSLNYGFDASGNLTSLPNGATGAYDKASELTSSVAGGMTTGYTFNADGQRLSSIQNGVTNTSGTWNGASQLISYTGPSSAMTAAIYNGDGLRVSSTTNSITESYVWDSVDPVPALLMDSENAYIYCTGGTPCEQLTLSTGARTYLVPDLLGSVRGTVASSGSLTGTTSYDAWGNPETSGGLTGITPFGIAGAYTDSTGLVYLINRYYDPGTGQFISVDPAMAQSNQAYGYASGDPLQVADPTGLIPMICPTLKCQNEENVDEMLFIDTLKLFSAIRKGICGSNWPVKYRNGKQNCYWLDNGNNGNTIVWSSDGCSPPAPYQIYNGKPLYLACERHDFGYRNYKAERRCAKYYQGTIDNNFYADLLTVCQHGVACDFVAKSYYYSVREKGHIC